MSKAASDLPALIDVPAQTDMPVLTDMLKGMPVLLVTSAADCAIAAVSLLPCPCRYKVEESDLPVLLVLPLDAPSEDEGASTYPKYDGELKHKPLLKFLSQVGLTARPQEAPRD